MKRIPEERKGRSPRRGERQGEEPAAAATEKQFRAMFEHAPIGVALATPEGVLLRTNRAFQEMVGYLEVEFTRMHLADFTHPDDASRLREVLKDLRDGRYDAFYLENRYRRKDGGIVWGHVAVCAVRAADGRVQHVVAMVEDISERKRAEEKLRGLLEDLEARVSERTRSLCETNKRLEAEIGQRARAEAEREHLLQREQAARAEVEAASRAKDEFLAILSHELRTPLTAMMGWTWMLRRKPMPPAQFQEVLAIVERNLKQEAQIVEDLLDISKIITGTMQLDVRTIDLRALVEAAVEIVRPAALLRKVAVRLELPPGPLWVRGDAERLQQVVWNLLSNGVKFSKADGAVVARLRPAGSRVELSVQDDGCGIAPDFLPFVFERFMQGERSMTREHGGLGLGLAIVRHIVDLHGGSVRARSDGQGKGSEFALSLPAAEAPATAAAAAAPRASGERVLAADLAALLAGVRVLVVDDDPGALAALRGVLERCGAIVEAAGTAAEAFAALRRSPPDVLVADLAMPGEDGFELIRKVRALPAEQGGQVPAAALTERTRAQDRTLVLLAGFQMYIPKPVEPAELAVVVEGLWRRPK